MNGACPDVINLNNEASPKKLNPNLRQKSLQFGKQNPPPSDWSLRICDVDNSH